METELNEFISGQDACKRGDACPVNATADFKRGYGAQYELEQALEWNPKAKHPELTQ